MISCAVTAQLICTFVFTYAKIWFSHDTAQHLRVCLFVFCFNTPINIFSVEPVRPRLYQYPITSTMVYGEFMCFAKKNHNPAPAGSNLSIWAASWENKHFAYAKSRAQISFTVNELLICATVSTTQIVKLLYFLNPKFPVSSHLQISYSLFVSDEFRNNILGFHKMWLIFVWLWKCDAFKELPTEYRSTHHNSTFEPSYGKANNLHRRKQRRRSASR